MTEPAYENDYGAKVQYLLGKLDGKVDTLLNNQSMWIAKVQENEKRISHSEQRLTTLETKSDEKKTNRSTIISVVSLFIAASVGFAHMVQGWFTR